MSDYKDLGYENLDNPRERFFGWFPRTKKQTGIFLWTVIWLFAAVGILPWLPSFWLFGWLPSMWVYVALIVPFVPGLGWTYYFENKWTALDDPDFT